MEVKTGVILCECWWLLGGAWGSLMGVCIWFGADVVGWIGDGKRGLLPLKALNRFRLSNELSLILCRWEVILWRVSVL